MNRTQTVRTAVLAIAIAAGTVGAQRAVAQQAQAAQQPQADLPKDMTGDTKVIVLSNSDLPGGKEATTFMTEIPPGSSTPRHYHPGQELAYVLEGTGVMHEIGKPSAHKAGFYGHCVFATRQGCVRALGVQHQQDGHTEMGNYGGNSKRISDNHPGEVAPARTSLRIQVPAFKRVPIARNDRRRALFPRKMAGSAVEGTTRQRGDPHPRRGIPATTSRTSSFTVFRSCKDALLHR